MKPWSYWFTDLLPVLPGCPSIQVQYELRRAAQTFFVATKAWKVSEAARAVTTGTQSVSAAPSDADQELVDILSVAYDGRDLKVASIESMVQAHGPNWRSHTGQPSEYLLLTPGEIRLYPIPESNATTGLELMLAVKPSDSATGIPDDLAVKYRDELNIGAKARLLIIPGKPWTNVKDGAAYGMAFDAMCGAGSAQVFSNFGRGRIGSRPSWC